MLLCYLLYSIYHITYYVCKYVNLTQFVNRVTFESFFQSLTSTMVLMNFVSDTPRCPSSNSGSKCRIIGSPLIAPSGQSSKLVKFVLFVKFCTICRASSQGGIRSILKGSGIFIKTYIRDFTAKFHILIENKDE